MNTTIRIMQASSEPMPELAAFLDPFRVHFARSEGPHALEHSSDFPGEPSRKPAVFRASPVEFATLARILGADVPDPQSVPVALGLKLQLLDPGSRRGSGIGEVESDLDRQIDDNKSISGCRINTDTRRRVVPEPTHPAGRLMPDGFDVGQPVARIIAEPFASTWLAAIQT